MYIDHGTTIQFGALFFPKDEANPDYAAYLAWVAKGNEPQSPPPPSVEARIEAMRAAIAAHLDAWAQTKGYDNIINASLRAAYAGPYHDEGVIFATGMDATWHAAYALLAQWQAGELAEPTAAELIAMLPELEVVP